MQPMQRRVSTTMAKRLLPAMPRVSMGETLNSSLICLASSDFCDPMFVLVAVGKNRCPLDQPAVSFTQHPGHLCCSARNPLLALRV
jgi:hypothetical protein